MTKSGTSHSFAAALHDSQTVSWVLDSTRREACNERV
jgi:hypothetical protein